MLAAILSFLVAYFWWLIFFSNNFGIFSNTLKHYL